MYMLIEASKGSYDRPIQISTYIYETKEKAIKDLIEWNDYEDLEEAVKEKKDYLYDSWGNLYLYLGYDEEEDLVFLSSGCPADNEYDGYSLKIVKCGDRD